MGSQFRASTNGSLTKRPPEISQLGWIPIIWTVELEMSAGDQWLRVLTGLTLADVLPVLLSFLDGEVFLGLRLLLAISDIVQIAI